MDAVIEFTDSPIVIPHETLPSREIGASLEFRGIVREKEGEHALAGLFYEAYEPMARKRLQEHFAELHRAYPCASIHFIHRLGWVPVGEASLYVRVLSAHRGEALCFLTEAIHRLKQDVPIWKMIKE